MIKKIAFVEDEYEVEAIIKKKVIPELWIALDPLSIPELENENLVFKLVEDYQNDSREFFDNTYPQSQKLIDLVINKTDNWIKKEYPGFSKYNVDLMKYFNFYLHILFDGIVYRLFLLKMVLEQEQPTSIYIFKKKQKKNLSTNFPWHYEESVWCYCLECLKANDKMNIPFSLNILEYDSDYTTEEVHTENSFDLYSASPYLYNILKKLKNNGFKYLFNFIKRTKVGILNFDYQWIKSEPLFNQKGYECIDIHTSAFVKLKYPVNKKNFVSAIGLDEHLYFDSINISSLVEDKLNFIISVGINNFIHNYKKILRFIKLSNIKALCFSMITNGNVWLIAQAAKNRNIPIFVWGHGASGVSEFTKQMDFELLICDYYFTQGKGSQEKYMSYSNHDFTPIPVGFSTLDSMKSNSVKAKDDDASAFLFLYVTSFLYRKRLYYSFYPVFSDNNFYLTQRTIINFLGNLKVNSLIKLYPSYIGKFKYIKDNQNLMVKKNNLHFKVDEKFSDLIYLADAIIIDCPTTVLLEALTTEKPIFVLTKHLKLTNDAEKLLKKRAVVCDNLENFIVELNEFVTRKSYNSDVLNTDYLKAYGTYLDDGKSAERGVNEIISRF